MGATTFMLHQLERNAPSPLNLSELVPLYGECSRFEVEVQKLCRPYIPISIQQYAQLTAGGADYYLTPDQQVVTFGNADGGYALMPLQKKFADNILEINGITLSRDVGYTN